MITKNYRKITVGDNFSNCIAYVKGVHYLGKSVKITNIVPSDKKQALDIYVQPIKKGSSQVLWKTIPKNLILEFEYDLNFK